jgi:hypothetical protein
MENYGRMQRGYYDAARNPEDLENYWANADSFDADSSNSKPVRETLTRNSRYETANNGYSDGIAQTYSTDLVGVGPLLRMQTKSPGFNQMVEFEFYLWCKAVQFRRKLWCLAHSKHVDGEGLAVLRLNRKVNHRVPLDIVLYETEQCQTPYLPFAEPGHIDGIKFDEFGNPLYYEFLHQHPGTTSGMRFDVTPEQVPADHVLHWFKMRRPGQHRGVPECASTLNLGAVFRRGRNAQISTWEKIASFTLFLKTMFEPEVAQAILPMSAMDINHNMMTALPNTVEPVQLKAEHPGANYPEAHKLWLNEVGRPKNMPYNKVACDSSSYNYASGRLDHQTYYGNLDVDRADCDDLVLDRVFDVWFDLAIGRFGWLGGKSEAIGPAARVHTWDWPKHRVADVESEANANRTKLESGQTFPHIVFTEAGLDFDDEVSKAALTFGVKEDEVRKRLFDVLLPAAEQSVPPAAKPLSTDEAISALFGEIDRRNRLPIVNGANHG